MRSQEPEQPTPTPTTKPSENKKMKYIVGGLIIIVGACLLYYFWTQTKKKDLSVKSSTLETPTPIIDEVSLPKAFSDISKPTFSFY